MIWRLPRPTRACCCVPLRQGIIAFVYLNLMLAIAAHCVFFILDNFKAILRGFEDSGRVNDTVNAWHKFTWITALALIIVGGIAEIIMTVIALIGLHRENLKIVAAYLHYTVVYTVLMVLTRAINFMLEMWKVEVPSIAIFMAIKVYYILLLRSEKIKQKAKEESAQEESNTIPDKSDTTPLFVNAFDQKITLK